MSSRERDRDPEDRKMSSRERDDSPAPHHQHHHLSSLIVRPSDSGGGGGGGGGGSDYEPGEVRRDPPPPPYSRSDRYVDSPTGNGTRAHSISPLRRRKGDHHQRSDFNHSSGAHRGHGYGGGRGPGRFRDSPPSYGRGRGGGRFPARDFDEPRFDHGPFRGESMSRNNPNLAPREGDWFCSDPACGNLNFARRDYCNHCDRPRRGPRDSPRRNYPGPLRMAGPPMDRSPPRGLNGYRSPPRGWSRDGPRDFGAVAPPLRNGGRFPDQMRRERPDYREDYRERGRFYREDDYRERGRFDRPMPPDWGHRDRGRDSFPNERRGFDFRNERRPLSPPLPSPPPRGRWAREMRDRSRSPIGGVPPKDLRRDSFVNRGRGGRWGMRRDRLHNRPY